jgi:orotate phosphoribosyltransferase
MQTPASAQISLTPATIEAPLLRLHLLDLFCTLAYREGDFTLSSGQKSTYYINGKQVTLHPAGAIAVGRLLLPLLPNPIHAVAGLTLGADPIVTAVSVVGAYENRSIAALIVRKEAKGHGTQAYIEGPALPVRSTVVVLEDVERLRDAGYVVNQVIALVDRQQGGAELYQQQGLQFQTLFTITEIQKRWAALNVS